MADDVAERPVDFDAWIAGRSAALTRFAYLLTGNEIAADQALTSALTTACATWSRVRRSDDPEALVQRLVVDAYLPRRGWLRRNRPAAAVPTPPPSRDQRDWDDATHAWRVCATLPPPQRAAVVLRCYAEMTYPQIAGAMTSKESAVRVDVERTFVALRVAIDSPRHDDVLEAAFRDAFEQHADDSVATEDRASLAHAGAQRRRRRQIVPAVAVATLLVAGAAAVAVSYDGSRPATTAAQPGSHPRGWRAESYNGIQLWVPSSWGWGQAPRLTSHGLVSCGVNAYSPTVVITGARYAMSAGAPLPYVGRPSEPDAGCGAPPNTMGAHVWFDSPLPPGDGPAQTTVRVVGVTALTITVADANRAEREIILASIERVAVDAHGCPRDSGGLRRVQDVAGPEPAPRLVRTLSLCLYAAAARDRHVLFYSTRVDAADARQATAQIEAAPSRRTAAVCLVTPAVNQVVLIARTHSTPAVFGVNPGICPEAPVGYVTGSSFHVLTEASLRLWAIDGLSLYANSGLGGDGLSPFMPSQ